MVICCLSSWVIYVSASNILQRLQVAYIVTQKQKHAKQIITSPRFRLDQTWASYSLRAIHDLITVLIYSTEHEEMIPTVRQLLKVLTHWEQICKVNKTYCCQRNRTHLQRMCKKSYFFTPVLKFSTGKNVDARPRTNQNLVCMVNDITTKPWCSKLLSVWTGKRKSSRKAERSPVKSRPAGCTVMGKRLEKCSYN